MEKKGAKNGKSRQNKLLPRHSRNNTRKRNMFKKQLWKCNRKNDEIISTGYSGAPRGRKNCLDLGYCIRKQKTDLSGAGYEMCRSVHSEQNAIISANRRDMLGATLYLVGINKRNGEYIADNYPCTLCKRMIINAGIEKVVMRDNKQNYRIEYVEEWIKNDDTLN